jgi:hypothetical protein
VPFEPRLDREAVDDAPTGRCRVALPIGEHSLHSIGKRLRLRGPVTVPGLGMGHADTRVLADELDRATALRVHDRQAARHRLEDEARTRIEHLCVQQQVSPAEQRRRLALAVATRELDPFAQRELVQQAGGVGDEPAGDNQPHLRQVRQRPERKLEAISLCLIAAQ